MASIMPALTNGPISVRAHPKLDRFPMRFLVPTQYPCPSILWNTPLQLVSKVRRILFPATCPNQFPSKHSEKRSQTCTTTHTVRERAVCIHTRTSALCQVVVPDCLVSPQSSAMSIVYVSWFAFQWYRPLTTTSSPIRFRTTPLMIKF